MIGLPNCPINIDGPSRNCPITWKEANKYKINDL